MDQSEQRTSEAPAVVFFDGDSLGWGPIVHMAQLMARLFDAPLERPAAPQPSRLRLAQRHIFRTRKGTGHGVIYLARGPQDIPRIVALPGFDRPHRFRALWIVDSFWTEWAPSSRLFSHFDLVAYMQKGEAAFYEGMAPGRSLWLGWGADVLGLGSARAERDVDVLRVGRQPTEWDDDARSLEQCRAAGLRFHGRPPFPPDDPQDPSASHRALMEYYARSRFLIAHSNLAAPAPYTHPEKAYLTGRWTDALACGAIVAGLAPHEDAGAAELFWPGATLDFDRIDLGSNVAQLADAVAGWTPEMAAMNHRQALIRLDWRWRFAALAEHLGFRAPALEPEMAGLKAAIARAAA